MSWRKVLSWVEPDMNARVVTVVGRAVHKEIPSVRCEMRRVDLSSIGEWEGTYYCDWSYPAPRNASGIGFSRGNNTSFDEANRRFWHILESDDNTLEDWVIEMEPHP